MNAKKVENNLEGKENMNSATGIGNTLLSQGEIQIDDPQSKTKTSFYISKRDQAFLKLLSDIYEIPQGEMIHWTTVLFFNIMQRSLERRKKSIPTLRMLSNQIGASIEAIKSIAPHLSKSFDFIYQEIICRIIDLEEKGVNNKVVSGIGEYSETDLDSAALEATLMENEGSDPPYKKDLLEMLGNVGVIDGDISKYYDTVPDDKLRELVAKGIVDPGSVLNFLQNRQRKGERHE